VAVRSISGLMLLLSLGGCSGASSSSGPGSGGAAGAGGTGGMASNGTVAGSSGQAAKAGASAQGGSGGVAGDGTGGDATTRDHYGQVLLQSMVFGSQGLSLNVAFTRVPTSVKCTTITDGPCRVDVCDDPGESTATQASAGTITVTSPEVMGTATSSPDASGNYYMPNNGLASVLSGGEHLHVSASGGEVPAFEGELDVPLVLLLSSPAYAKPQARVEIPRASDLSLVWTRGVEDVLLWVQGQSSRVDGEPGYAFLLCNFPSEMGSGTIKSTLLQQLAVDNRIYALTVGSKRITAGDYSVTLGAALPTANADKEIVPAFTLK
jgi:hypothetical protein